VVVETAGLAITMATRFRSFAFETFASCRLTILTPRRSVGTPTRRTED
jgi:hypothetical protein